MLRNKAFSLPEVLLVAVIIGILASIATLPFLNYTNKARAAEAVATLARIRQALRDYHINHGTYFDVASNHIQDLPTTGLEINVGVAQYFSNHSYTVDATNPTSTRFTNPGPVDFIISVDGSASVSDGSTNSAIHGNHVSNYRLEMDNSGRIFISYNVGTNWRAY